MHQDRANVHVKEEEAYLQKTNNLCVNFLNPNENVNNYKMVIKQVLYMLIVQNNHHINMGRKKAKNKIL